MNDEIKTVRVLVEVVLSVPEGGDPHKSAIDFRDEVKASLGGDVERFFYGSEEEIIERFVEEGEGNAKRRYFGAIKDMAQDIKERIDTGDIEDADTLSTHIWEEVDGCSWVIYTAKAIDVLRFSDNDGYALEEWGADVVVENGAINYSKLAFGAVYADLMQALEDLDVDLNDPNPKGECHLCSEEFSAGEGVESAVDDRLYCSEDCRVEAEDEIPCDGCDNEITKDAAFTGRNGKVYCSGACMDETEVAEDDDGDTFECDNCFEDFPTDRRVVSLDGAFCSGDCLASFVEKRTEGDD